MYMIKKPECFSCQWMDAKELLPFSSSLIKQGLKQQEERGNNNACHGEGQCDKTLTCII